MAKFRQKKQKFFQVMSFLVAKFDSLHHEIQLTSLSNFLRLTRGVENLIRAVCLLFKQTN
jgi:hypothetical protein